MQEVERFESLAVTLLRVLHETAHIGRLGWRFRAHQFWMPASVPLLTRVSRA
jgi:hypothetical protein